MNVAYSSCKSYQLNQCPSYDACFTCCAAASYLSVDSFAAPTVFRRDYIEEESKDKRKESFDLTGWTNFIAEDRPMQVSLVGNEPGVGTESTEAA